MSDFTTEIAGHTIEYYDNGHLYLIDGEIVSSVTQILKTRFGGKYDGIDPAVLKRAADKGTAVHDAIERYCKTGDAGENLHELRNFVFLQKRYGFEVLENETPVMLFGEDGEPLAVGRCDLVLRQDGMVGGADIKRTATLDREYLACQLNLYRIAYRQTYGTEWQFLRGIHLRDDIRKYVSIPIDENKAWTIINEWRRQRDGLN